MKRFLRNTQIAERLGVAPRTVARWMASGYLPPSRRLAPNVCGLFEDELDQWLEENAVRDEPMAEAES